MSYPQLFEDGTRSDWEFAHYKSTVKIALSSCKATAYNSLGNCQQLQELIDSGAATWQLEVRCPRSLYSKTISSQEPQIEATWNNADMIGSIFFFTGLYATRELTLRPEELTPIWKDAGTIKVPQGWQLIRANTVANDTEIDSLLRFVRKEDLDKGTMEISENTGSGSLEFIVELAANIYDEMRHDRTLQIAALIGAMSKLQGKEWEKPDPIYKPIKNYFETHDLVSWDSEKFDPATVATSIEPFRPSLVPALEEDE